MSRRGNCWNNAVAESFLSSLTKEQIKKRIYTTREIATAEIYEYIEMFYNRTGDTAISVGSVRRPLKPFRFGLNDVSAKGWEVQSAEAFFFHNA